jgi:hypothetical protein
LPAVCWPPFISAPQFRQNCVPGVVGFPQEGHTLDRAVSLSLIGLRSTLLRIISVFQLCLSRWACRAGRGLVEAANWRALWALDPTVRLLSLTRSRLAGGRNGQDSSVPGSPGVAKACGGKARALSDGT